MRLFRWVRLTGWRYGYFAGLATVLFGPKMAFIALPLTLCLFAIWLKLVLPRIQRALDDGDIDFARALSRTVAKTQGQNANRVLTFIEAHVCMAEERWSDAATIYQSADRSSLGPALRIAVDNNLAWALAHAGEPERAVELARACAASATKKQQSNVLGTLGGALALAGRHGEARTTLERALALGGTKRNLGIRRYYLGIALAGLGQLDEARRAWEQAAQSPSRTWAAKARECLKQPAAQPYRN